jgi:glycosyltransferase involved in cell wall biosynthesis
MRILFVCSAKTWGGNEKWTAMAMKHLSTQHEVYFFGRNKALSDSFGEATAKGFAPMLSNWDAYSFAIARRFLIKHRIDCVVSTKKKEYFIFGVLSRMLGIRHIIRLGIVRNMSRPVWHHLVYGRLNDGIIVNAQRIKDNLRKYNSMKNKKIYVLYNAIPGLLKIEETMPEGSGAFHIVGTGMLTRRKGFAILIEALARLSAADRQNLKVTIVGEGRERKNLKRLITWRKLDGIITLAGFQPDPLAYLKQASLFVLLSENEGISNALIEAMAAGVPVLTTDSGGTKEFVEDGTSGFIVPRDIAAVHAKLERILSMPKDELTAIGREGKQAVVQVFDEKKFDQQVNRIFSE